MADAAQIAREVNKNLDSLRVFETQLAKLRKDGVSELDPQLWQCKRKMALCCATGHTTDTSPHN